MAVTVKDIDFSKTTPSPRTEQRVFRERGEQRYSLEVLPVGLTFWVDRLRRERHELIGELLVTAKPGTPNVLMIGENGTISAGDMNFSSVQARSTRAKLLASRAELSGVDWHGLVEEFCLRTIQAERLGKPAVVLADVNLDVTDVDTSAEWDIDGFPLLKTLPTMLFADSESGKSYFAMWIMGRLAQMGENVMYCDWEFDEREHRRRLGRLFQPMPKNLFYVRCDTPFPQQVDRLAKLLHQHKCRYMVIDSVGFAAEGPAETQETAAKHFKALRILGVGSLNIAHTPKSTEEGRDATIYGSTFWKAGARSIWFIDKAQVNPKGELRFGLHHRKNNVGERMAPRGYRLVWDKQRTRVEKIDIRSVEELTAGLPILERIKKILGKGMAHPKYLADELSVPIGSIRSTLSRHKSQFTKHGAKVALSAEGREDEAPPAPKPPADTEMF